MGSRHCYWWSTLWRCPIWPRRKLRAVDDVDAVTWSDVYGSIMHDHCQQQEPTFAIPERPPRWRIYPAKPKL
jgi:hypothetical protein